MPPATRPLAHLAVALCVGAAMSACAGTETRPDPSLAVGQRPANDAVAQLMRHVPPIYPAVLTIWTDRASQPESSLGTLARALNPTLPEDLTPLEAVGVTLAPGLAQRRLPPLQGLDRARPVIAGVFGARVFGARVFMSRVSRDWAAWLSRPRPEPARCRRPLWPARSDGGRHPGTPRHCG